MLWLTLQQLKGGTAAGRKKAVRDLWREADPRSLKALARALAEDKDQEVRQIAASALGRINDAAKFEPLMRALQDPDAEVVRSAVLAMRRAKDERVVTALVPMLRHRDFGVRTSAAQAIDTVRWVPEHREDRIWFQVAKGWYERAATSGAHAIEALEITVRTGPVHCAIRAIEALGGIQDPSVADFLISALKADEPAVRIAAADALGESEATQAAEALMACLRSDYAQVRVAAISALGSLGASEATSVICKMLTDKEWEVRQQAAATLGKLKNAAALEPLAAALRDPDGDVRESAAIALGKIRDRRALTPLLLALADEISSVRRMAAASLSRIEPDWISLPETRAAANQLKDSIKDAEPAVKYFVIQLLVNMGELPADALSGASSEPVSSPTAKRQRMATQIFMALLEDPDRDARQAAVEALGSLGGERARQALTRTASDPDGDVAAATQMALQALAPAPGRLVSHV